MGSLHTLLLKILDPPLNTTCTPSLTTSSALGEPGGEEPSDILSCSHKGAAFFGIEGGRDEGRLGAMPGGEGAFLKAFEGCFDGILHLSLGGLNGKITLLVT